jgi:hypothetical protein
VPSVSDYRILHLLSASYYCIFLIYAIEGLLWLVRRLLITVSLLIIVLNNVIAL